MPALGQPVQAGNAHIQHPGFDIAADFLHAAERGRDFRIVDVREIVAGVLADFPARAFEKIDGGFFQRALGHAQFDDRLRLRAHEDFLSPP